MKKTNKKNIKIIIILSLIVILICLCKHLLFWSSVGTSKKINPDATEPIVIEQNLESYHDKATLEFNISLSSGNLNVEVFDNNDNSIWQDDIDAQDSYKKNIKIHDFHDKVKIKITPKNASADVNIEFKSR